MWFVLNTADICGLPFPLTKGTLFQHVFKKWLNVIRCCKGERVELVCTLFVPKLWFLPTITSKLWGYSTLSACHSAGFLQQSWSLQFTKHLSCRELLQLYYTKTAQHKVEVLIKGTFCLLLRLFNLQYSLISYWLPCVSTAASKTLSNILSVCSLLLRIERTPDVLLLLFSHHLWAWHDSVSVYCGLGCQEKWENTEKPASKSWDLCRYYRYHASSSAVLLLLKWMLCLGHLFILTPASKFLSFLFCFHCPYFLFLLYRLLILVLLKVLIWI